MIGVIHQIAKWGAVLWTALCAIIGVLFLIGLAGSTTAGTETATGFTMVFGVVFLGCLWFFPTLGAIIAMYFTRPQAWQPKQEIPSPFSTDHPKAE